MEEVWLSSICSFVLILLVILIRHQLNRMKNLPPGPLCLPIVGYYPFLGKFYYITLAKLKKKYGSVMSVYLGSRYCLVLNDIESMKEAYTQHSFNGRPPDSSFRLTTKTAAFVEYSGVQWSEQRRFSLKVLRNLGFGKTRLEEVIKEEVDIMLEDYEKKAKSTQYFEKILDLSTRNVINVLLFGRRFSFDDPERIAANEYLDKIGFIHTPVSLHACFPWLRKLFFKLGLHVGVFNYGLADKLVQDVVDDIWKEIHSHEKTLNDGNEEPRDYIDSYLEETKRYTKQDDVFTKENLNGNIQLFLRAGTMSSNTTLKWCLMVCAKYPNMQKRIQFEIDSVLGKEKPPSWSDHEKMPYTEAFIFEIQRWKTAVPMNLLRYTTSDTKIQGYNVPAGTIVLGNLWAAHNDTKYWENPERMMPERFLNEDGTKVLMRDSFVPFALGRRKCPGALLAYETIFLYLTRILQNYNVVVPSGKTLTFEGFSHMTHHPLNFEILLESR